MNIFEELKKWREERGLTSTVGNIQANLAEELTELLRANTEEEKIDALCDMIVFSINAMEAMGYDAKLAIEETIKEVASRKGEMSKELNKWVKFKDEESKKNWYNADYLKCKKRIEV